MRWDLHSLQKWYRLTNNDFLYSFISSNTVSWNTTENRAFMSMFVNDLQEFLIYPQTCSLVWHIGKNVCSAAMLISARKAILQTNDTAVFVTTLDNTLKKVSRKHSAELGKNAMKYLQETVYGTGISPGLITTRTG